MAQAGLLKWNGRRGCEVDDAGYRAGHHRGGSHSPGGRQTAATPQPPAPLDDRLNVKRFVWLQRRLQGQPQGV